MAPTPPGLRLVLASSSPRRRDLLDALGLAFVVRPAHADEAAHADETSSAFVERLAREKAAKVAGAGELVLAADTTVVHGGRRLGKPADPAEAAWMLRELSGETHTVSTGVAIRVIRGPGAIASASTVCTTRVTFSPLSDRDIDWYVATGEPLDKAGAYGIQDAGGLFVERIEGSYTNVVGLPLAETAALMRGRDIDLLDFTR